MGRLDWIPSGPIDGYIWETVQDRR